MRGEITDLVVNTWAAELENMLYKVPGKLKGIKERSHLDGFKKHRVVVSSEDMNKPSSPKTEREAQGKWANMYSCYRHVRTWDRHATGTTRWGSQQTSSLVPVSTFHKTM